MSAKAILGDATNLLRVQPASADMVYCDPPFGTGLTWRGPAGSFTDRFAAMQGRYERVQAECPLVADLIGAADIAPQRRAYLFFAADLIMACKVVMRPAASLWLHCDDTSSHWLKIIADLIFGPEAYLGEIIWRRSASHSSAQCFGRVHDTILCFARSRVAQWRLARLRSDLVHGDPCERVFVAGFLEMRLASMARERVGYPTQKPISLVSKLIETGCPAGGIVIDPTCGSGTTLVAALSTGRHALGIDISRDAIRTTRYRISVLRAPAGATVRTRVAA